MEGIYKINLIPSDLSTEESVLQIANTLDNLNGIVEDVFGRVLKRIQLNVNKTKNLKERIEISKAKVEKLNGMQKAIKVFSSAKYPSSIKHEHYESIFGLDRFQYTPQKITLKSKSQGTLNEKGIQEKLHFYHVKIGRPKDFDSKQEIDLRKVLETVSTVGELIIFDTDESPYFGDINKTRYMPIVKSKVETKSSLEAAPSSIMNRDVLKREADEYMYAPGMGMVPELEMPQDLPHLPGIAGDVQFSITTDGSIAPSAVTSPVSPVAQLPEAELLELPDLKELPDVNSSVEEPFAKSPLPDIPDAPPVSAAPSSPAPPPPPPPPPSPPPIPQETTPVQSATKPKVTSQVSTPPAGDSRANLMEAIRKAGGAGRAKLRPAASSTPVKGQPNAGGDLMADLHAKLTMRRKGISGSDRGGGSVLHTLASVIPEPGELSSPQHSSSEDDWE